MGPGLGQEAAAPSVAPNDQSAIVQAPDAAAAEPAPAPSMTPVPDADAPAWYLNADGSLTARITTIDPSTLKLVPSVNCVLSFVQNGKLIVRGTTGPDGYATVNGLAPWGVYSVFATGPTFAAFSVYIKPADSAPGSVAKNRKGPDGETLPVSSQLSLAAQGRLVQNTIGSATGGNAGSGVPRVTSRPSWVVKVVRTKEFPAARE